MAPLGVRLICVAFLALGSKLSYSQGYEIELIRGTGNAACEAYAQARNADPAKGIKKCRIGRPLSAASISRPILTPKYLNLTVPPSFDGPEEVQVKLAQENSALLHKQIVPFSLKHDARLVRYFNYKMAVRVGWRDEIGNWSRTQEQQAIARASLMQHVIERLAVYALPTVTIDVNNDGSAETLFFYLREIPSWTPAVNGVALGAPIVLTTDGRQVDGKTTLQVFRQPIAYDASVDLTAKQKDRELPAADFLTDSQYGFFQFDGKTYYDFAFGSDGLSALVPESDKGIERVFLSDRAGTREVCAVRCKLRTAPPKKQ